MSDARPTQRYVLLSLASGVIWGTLAFFLGRDAFGSFIWGGVIASPLIGVGIGSISRRFVRLSTRWRVVLALVDLYLAATCFALAVATYQILTRPFIPELLWWAPLSEVTLSTLFGLTMTGYVLVLWPLSYWNHWLLGKTCRTVGPQALQPR